MYARPSENECAIGQLFKQTDKNPMKLKAFSTEITHKVMNIWKKPKPKLTWNNHFSAFKSFSEKTKNATIARLSQKYTSN